jgi:microcystin-dependent protein
MSEMYIGQIVLFGGNFAPKGWMFCAGQILPIAQNSALFAILGTTYGGNGTSTFALPDLRSRVPVGVGQGTGLSPYTLGQAAGAENVVLTVNEIPSHVHAHTPVAVNNTGTLTDPTNAVLAQANDGQGGPILPSFAPTSATQKVNMAPDTTSAVGGSAGHTNVQPYLGLNYIICVQGLFPPRN